MICCSRGRIAVDHASPGPAMVSATVDPPCRGRRLDRLDGACVMIAADRHRRRVHDRLAGREARDVEQIVDQPRLHQRVALDDLQAPSRDPAASSEPAAQHVRPAEDRVERRAQLVRHDRQELVLHPAGGLRLPPRRQRVGQLAPLLLAALALGDVELRPQHQDRTAVGIAHRPARARQRSAPYRLGGRCDARLRRSRRSPARSRTASSRPCPIVAMDHREEAVIRHVEAARARRRKSGRPRPTSGADPPRRPTPSCRRAPGPALRAAGSRSTAARPARALGRNLGVQFLVGQLAADRSARDTRRSSWSYSRCRSATSAAIAAVVMPTTPAKVCASSKPAVGQVGGVGPYAAERSPDRDNRQRHRRQRRLALTHAGTPATAPAGCTGSRADRSRAPARRHSGTPRRQERSAPRSRSALRSARAASAAGDRSRAESARAHRAPRRARPPSTTSPTPRGSAPGSDSCARVRADTPIVALTTGAMIRGADDEQEHVAGPLERLRAAGEALDQVRAEQRFERIAAARWPRPPTPCRWWTG